MLKKKEFYLSNLFSGKTSCFFAKHNWETCVNLYVTTILEHLLSKVELKMSIYMAFLFNFSSHDHYEEEFKILGQCS